MFPSQPYGYIQLVIINQYIKYSYLDMLTCTLFIFYIENRNQQPIFDSQFYVLLFILCYIFIIDICRRMSNNQLNPYISPDQYGGASGKELKAINNMADNQYNYVAPKQNDAQFKTTAQNDLWAQTANQIAMNPAANPLNNNYYPQGQPVSYPQPPYNNAPIGYQAPYQPAPYQQGYPPNYQPGAQYQVQPPMHNQYRQNVPMPPPPPPIIINNNSGNICQFCHKNASVFHRRKAGCAVWSWCLCLFLFTGLCCWIPCVIDDCHDEEVICSSCQGVKAYFTSRYGC